MEYFQIETDKKNRIPYSINVNRAVDIRYANRKMVKRRTHGRMEYYFSDGLEN